MKKILVVIVLLIFVNQAQAIITDINILPSTPTIVDPITILVSGIEGSPVQITNSDFLINGNSLLLNIYLELSVVPVETPWTHSEFIGTLPAETYNLDVHTFFPLLPPLNDNYSMSFEVVPEPASVLLVGTGLLFVRLRRIQQ